ncbi:MAG: sodium-dependent transporter [Alphaproteobacteria bacterium]|nr:sodium-dependent transporter [Alphaproteobacteria bacterium]MBU2084445.1 sodium-dependent transporter [Alphaproteobacteria bacterium]MBU2142453.1 sodium-dependent transporter [Alphaproteobacteria bacterium]MBU2197794.1 sodium-dependent transporter [Alphaproteobacteria bacterium]
MAGIGRKTDKWGSRFGFIMAAVGSSVGLGNFWRFPYTAGEEGGGAFILIYMMCVLLIGLPLLMAEYAMGRKSGMSAVEGIQSLARAESKSQNWGIAPWIGTLTAFFILSFYVVISAWLIAFLLQSFGGFNGMDAAASGQNFADTIGQGEHPLRSKWYILALLACFIGANVFVVGRGIKGGIEKASSILMPAFFVMLIVVVGFSVTNGDTARAAAFILQPKWADVGFGTFLAAIGQAFFSIGVGVGLMITYGAYLSKDTDITRSSLIVVASDTLVALIAGFAIFPIVFAAGLDPAGGPSLFFVSMPVAFGAIPGGAIFASVFFALALFAAFTSSISLLEVGVSWLEERQGVTRLGAASGLGFGLFMIGAAYVFSLEYLDFMDFMTEGLLLPLGGLLTVIFAGWVLSREMLTSELGEGTVMNLWRLVMRWFVPPFVGIILVFGFMDKIQDQYNVQLPGALTVLLGPNWVAPVE